MTTDFSIGMPLAQPSIGYNNDDTAFVTAEVNPVSEQVERLAAGSSWLPADGTTYAKRNAGGVVCDWSANYGALALTSANAGGEAIAIDPTVKFNGMDSVKLSFTSTAGATTYTATYTPTNPISLLNFKSLLLPIKVSSTNLVANTSPIQVWLGLNASKSVRLRLDCTGVTPDGYSIFSWTRDNSTISVSFASGATGWADLDASPVILITVVVTCSAAANGTPVWLGPLVANQTAKGIVSCRMDGEYDNQYTLLKPLFDAAGIKCSLALIHQAVDTAGRMTTAQLTDMLTDGHEAIHHTYSNTKINGYANATDWPTAVSITDDINAGWANIRAKGWSQTGIGKCVEAYSGNYSSATTAVARQRLIKSALNAAGVETLLTVSTTNNGAMQMPAGREFQEFAPAHVRCALSITSTTTPAQVIAAIDHAEQYGEWLVLLMHNAVPDSQTPTGNAMKVSDYAAWIDYLAGRVAAGAIYSETVSRAFDRLYK